MTIKQKFSSIDQSKLTADQKAFLDKIKDVTKNFTDSEMNKKVEAPLDGFIAKAKEKMPEAIKSAPARRTTKGKAKSSQTRKPKRTAMSLAKEIRKEGESWNEARARASKMMKEDSKDLSKTVETELDKLSKLVKSQKSRAKLVGISGTDIKRDAVRKAKPRGARKVTHSGETSNQYGTYKNHLGRKYYESRDRHSDRLAPRYPKNAPYLAEGGYLTDPNFGNFQNTMFAKGGGVRTINGREYSYGRNWTNDHNLTNKGEEYEVKYTRKKRFELGGVMATDLAGHTGGGTGGLNAGMPLDGFSNTAYTGLVGETGAMSSGEMFMAGGFVNSKFNLDGYKKHREFDSLKEAKEYVDLDRTIYGKSHSIVIKNGDDYEVWVTPTKGKTGNRVYEAGGGLPNGASQSYMVTEAFGNPAQHYGDGGGLPAGAEQSYVNYYLGQGSAQGIYARGGGVKTINGREYSYGRNWTNDHRHINQDEEHEVTYNRKGKFLGIFKEGGAIKNQYAGRTPEDIWDSLSVEQRKHFLIDHLWANEEQIEQIRYKRLEEDDKEFVDYYAVRTWKKLSGDVRKAFTSHVKEGEYNKGGAITNERKHVNHDEDYEVRYAKPRPHRKGYKGVRGFNKGGALTNERKHVNHDEDYEVRYAKPRPHRKGYKGARKFMAGGSMETPKIYVADLEAYNNGRLSGVWLDLADYNDADELMEAIQDFLKTSGGEEYAIHDVEYVPRSMYSEYMGQRDFEELYEMIDLAKDNNLPLSVVQEVVSQYDASAVNEFQGRYDNAEDFAEQLVDEMGGLENFSSPEYYVDITDTDRRLLAGDMADSYVDDIRDEDGGNRVIEEAGLDLDEYEEADSERREEMVDEAVEIVREEYYDTWYEGLSDPYEFLVEEQGMYSPEDLFNASFIRIDYEKLARDLEQDYTFIYEDGELYVFNIR